MKSPLHQGGHQLAPGFMDHQVVLSLPGIDGEMDVSICRCKERCRCKLPARQRATHILVALQLLILLYGP